MKTILLIIALLCVGCKSINGPKTSFNPNTMKRYIFIRPENQFDIRVIETSADYSEISEQYGYSLFSITKI